MRPQNTEQLLTQHFRRRKDIAIKADLSHGSGYFPFGSEAICYEYSTEIRAIRETDKVHVSSQYLHRNGLTVQLPLDPVQSVDNLRFERYVPFSKMHNFAPFMALAALFTTLLVAPLC